MNSFDTSMMNGKKKVLLRGPVLTQSGYGVHARQVAQWLLGKEDVDLEIQALPWGDTPWIIQDKYDDGLIGRIMQRTVDPSGRTYDVTFQLQLPNEWDPSLGRINVGITAGVETDRAHSDWAQACNKMSLVIVPSSHSEASLKAAGTVDTKIVVVPEAYSPAIDKNDKTQIDDVSFSTSFNFLLFGQITGNNPENDRKNLFYCVKWLCEAFEDDPEVGVVVKTNTGRNTHIDRKLVTSTFENLLREVRKEKTPVLHLVHGDMSDAEVASLYRHPQIKALVAPTRGEGYGLPILEAAASGLPVIATGWSGHTDFLSCGKYVDLGYKLEPIHPSRVDNRIFVQGARWANVTENEFKKKVIKFRNASSTPKEWALDMRSKLIESHSISKICQKYSEVTMGIV